MANSERIKKYTTNLKNANQRAYGFENELKQTRLDLAVVEQVAIHARNEAETALAQMNKALQELVELQKVAFGKVFQKVFDRDYNRAGDSYEKQVVVPKYFSESLACLHKRSWDFFRSLDLDCGSPTIRAPRSTRGLLSDHPFKL